MNTVLELRSLSKHFPSHRAVDGVSLSLERGEFFSLLGPSGCGKTTTLRMIAGFEVPTSGEIYLKGKPVAHLKPYERNVNTVFQNYALFPHLTVARNVAFGLEQRRGCPAKEISERVDSILSLVQLSGKHDRLPSEISGGERQRTALARSLVLEPDLLLLDEPLSALDPKLRKQVRAELKNLQRRVGITFLFITHDQEEALALSDRMAVMNRGRIEQQGSPRDLYLRPESQFVAEFLGDVNWINGAGIRPEALQLSRERPSQDLPYQKGIVSATTFLGNSLLVSLHLDDGSLCTAQSSQITEHFVAGEERYIWWHPDDELPIPRPA